MLKRASLLISFLLLASLTVAQEATTNRSVPLYERPDATSVSRLNLPAGLQLQVLREEGDWILVATSNMTMGWVPRDALQIAQQQVQPPPQPAAPSNQAPRIIGRIPDLALVFNRDTYSQDLSGVFTDPDGDVLRYSVSAVNRNNAVAYLEGTLLHVLPGSMPGQTTVNVRADDPGGLFAELSFAVTAQAAPSPVVQPPAAEATEEETDMGIEPPQQKGGKGWIKWALIGGGLVAGGVAAAVLLGGGDGGGGGGGEQLPGPPPLPN
jgi:hypothetical protein